MLLRCGGRFADLIAEEAALVAALRAAETIGWPLGGRRRFSLAALLGRDPRDPGYFGGRVVSCLARVLVRHVDSDLTALFPARLAKAASYLQYFPIASESAQPSVLINVPSGCFSMSQRV